MMTTLFVSARWRCGVGARAGLADFLTAFFGAMTLAARFGQGRQRSGRADRPFSRRGGAAIGMIVTARGDCKPPRRSISRPRSLADACVRLSDGTTKGRFCSRSNYMIEPRDLKPFSP